LIDFLGLPFDQAMLVLAVALARITPSFAFLPFLNDKTVGRGALRATLLALIAVALLPLPALSELDIAEQATLPALLTEAFLGLLLGMALNVPWMAVQTCGEWIDHQRGATMANAIDPATGIEASPVATFLGLLWTTVFLLNGGIQELIGLLAQSYQHVPIGTVLHLSVENAQSVLHLLTMAILTGIGLASPAIAAMLLTELALGLLSRFAPQLNAFSVSLTIKSSVAVLILLMYLNPHLLAPVHGLLDAAVMHTPLHLFDPR
jgi:type III secretion protein SpaR/YscT/HrcT